MLLGVIADAFTGANNIASFLVENGLSTVQFNGMPEKAVHVEAQALVISLKSRSCPREDAITQLLYVLS